MQAELGVINPRIIRLKDAHKYLGVSRSRFFANIRHQIPEIRLGKRTICFEKVDLDNWLDNYKRQHSRPAQSRRVDKWGKRESQACIKGAIRGTSTSMFTDKDFAKVLSLARSKKLKST